ncbi:MAG: DNA polymerase III subunit beta [Candidatus Sungbacteria bacterium GWC2_49_10]|uniref:Beta sliding clamp n=1 Tax=Candidatus Sungbacteria bacterium GWC2_49_10 TaxID=1802263 RepID=A0A1G2K1H3_9BACT|nr:MAG: polymerase III subunit beta protein [Parcubacteria group bacterium GW2011_GWB1_50_9]OGZ93289.1 MAG: DNA polymerase III subunit beta [Candidatus Sungbacteria bacterium GWC2_49_10]
MKAICAKEVFEYSISLAERFTGKNINLPALNTILIEAANNTLIITATNLEYAVQVSVPAKIQSPGKVAVPAKVLTQVIQSIQEENIDLEGKQETLVVKTTSREGKIIGVRSDDFPLIPKIKKTHTYTFSSLALVDGIAKILPAVSISEFKPELNGIFFKIAPKELTLAATDTFRLAEKKIKIPDGEVEAKTFILPGKIGQEIVRIFGGYERGVALSLGENQIEISTGDVRILSRLIDGMFPEYSAIIPKSFSTSLFLPKNEFANAIRSSSIFSSRLQDVHLTFSPKKVEIKAENAEIGLTTISLPCELTGKPLAINFNYRFLLDGVWGTSEDELFFGANDANAPALLRNKSDASFSYVIMPIRLT